MRSLPRSLAIGRLTTSLPAFARRLEAALARSRWTRVLRALVLVAVIAVLGHRIAEIGWGAIRQALPRAPLFYVLFLLLYLSLPLSEAWIYGRLWRRPMWPHLGTLLTKQAYNFGILAYAGESYFGLWAHRTLGVPNGMILRSLKDNNIVSALASNAMTLVLLLVLFALPGGLASLDAKDASSAIVAGGAILAGVMLAVLILRKRIFSLDRRVLWRLFAVHALRLGLVVLLQALQWSVALPQVAMTVWIALIAVQFVITRLPMVPNKDLVFLAVALGLIGGTGVGEEDIAAVLLASLGLAQLAHLAIFLGRGGWALGRHAQVSAAIGGSR